MLTREVRQAIEQVKEDLAKFDNLGDEWALGYLSALHRLEGVLSDGLSGED